MASNNKSAQKNEKSQTAFQWTPEMIQHLIICLKEYKTEMDYKNIDFNSDVVVMYSKLRERMALAFDEECFGPVDLPEPDCDTMTIEQEKKFQTEVGLAKSLIKKGYNRIKEKIRAIRKSYNKAVTNGTRSGSGKIVQEYYDQLAEIWKGSPATEQLGFGISSNVGESSASNTPSESSLELDNSLLSQLPETPAEADATEDPLLDDSGDDGDNEGDYNFIILI